MGGGSTILLHYGACFIFLLILLGSAALLGLWGYLRRSGETQTRVRSIAPQSPLPSEMNDGTVREEDETIDGNTHND